MKKKYHLYINYSVFFVTLHPHCDGYDYDERGKQT